MKNKIAIILISIGTIFLILSIVYRNTLKKYLLRTRERTRISHIRDIKKFEIEATGIKPEIEENYAIDAISIKERKSLFKEIMEYLKEILASLSSITGFIMYLLERKKKRSLQNA